MDRVPRLMVGLGVAAGFWAVILGILFVWLQVDLPNR